MYLRYFHVVQKEQKQQTNKKQIIDIVSEDKEENSVKHFDVNTLSITQESIGTFPFLLPPENYCYGYCSSWKGQPHSNDFDKQYFAVK